MRTNVCDCGCARKQMEIRLKTFIDDAVAFAIAVRVVMVEFSLSANDVVCIGLMSRTYQ